MTANLRPLLKKDVCYQWLSEHEDAFQKIKDLLTSDAVVHFYDKSLPLELLTDASRLHGLGCALIQMDKETG